MSRDELRTRGRAVKPSSLLGTCAETAPRDRQAALISTCFVLHGLAFLTLLVALAGALI